MSCSCKNINLKLNDNFETNTDPFETCPLCAYKHLSYALIKFLNNEIDRSIGQIYLAYRHLNLNFENESKFIFNLIMLFFNDELTIEKIKESTQSIHNLATNHKNIVEKVNFKNNIKLNLENELFGYQRIYLNLVAINELFNYEVGYKDINTSYVIGLLQECSEFEKNIYSKNKFRNIWKLIESDFKITSELEILINEYKYRVKKHLISLLNEKNSNK